MTTELFLDTETFSECDLISAGTHRYAEHPSTEIIVVQWAFGDDEPMVADCTTDEIDDWLGVLSIKTVLAEIAAGKRPGTMVIAHNSHFDRTVIRKVWGIDVPPEYWRDTMVKALAHGMPGGLDRVGAALDVAQVDRKDDRGKKLIQLFCKPAPVSHKRRTRLTNPEEWLEFLEYSRQDIPAMRAIHRTLPSWNYSEGHRELALWHLDQKINDRGFAVDLELAEKAIAAVALEQQRLKKATQEATSGLVGNVSQRDNLLAYILAEYGVTLPDMKADTLRRRIEDPDLPDGVKLLLSMRLEATKTSTAKYRALRNATSADGRIRNTTQFGGAPRTNRWAGRIFQPQNMTRPDLKLVAAHFGISDKEAEEYLELYIEQGIEALKGGFALDVFDNVIGMTSNLVRSAIVAPPGKKLTIADLANIEGRGLAELAGEEWKLEAFREYDAGTGPDLYVMAYARAFNVPPASVIKWMRQIGKVMELGLGYQGGVAAFLTFAIVYNLDLESMADAVLEVASREAREQAEGMYDWVIKKKRSTFGLSRDTYIACEILKAGWRTGHPATQQLWGDVEQATLKAIASPGQVFRVRDLAFRRDGAWLRIRLPSGRYLCYLQPRVSDKGEISYMGINQYTRQWARIKTYGGKLVENIVQAWARDVLAWNMPAIDAAGYEIVLTVHDEIITETPDTEAFTAEGLGDMMCRNPPWAPHCPLAAAGFETYRYRKD